MPNHPPSAQDLAGRISDAETGTTALHQAAGKGTLKDISGVTAEFLATVKDKNGQTPLHDAAHFGHLDQIPGLNAELLATVKNDYGRTPLHVDAGPVPQGPALFSSNPRANARA